MLTIVFDLDGTLIDTAPDLISTLNLILSGEGLPPVAYNDGRRMRTSLTESPTMIACAGSPPARNMVWRSISGSGFCTPKVSWPQIATK